MRHVGPMAVILVLPQLAFGASITKDGVYAVSGMESIPINALAGVTSGISINLGSGSQPSGDIQFVLDSSRTGSVLLNFDSGRMTFDFNILATFPLQASIGAAPVPLHIVEDGSLSPFNLTLSAGSSSFSSVHDGEISQPLLSPQATSGGASGTFTLPSSNAATFFFDPAALSGGGVVTTGPFTGFDYTNAWTVSATVSGSATFPGGSVGGSITISNAPEPSSLLLMGTSVFLLAGYRARRSLGRSAA
jgi:hypothetical protein